MVDEGKQRTLLAAEIAIKCLSGDVQTVAQVDNRNIFIPLLGHNAQNTLLQLPLAACRLLCDTTFVHETSSSL